MNGTTRDTAIVAASKAYSHLIAARKHLIDERLPLAGVHYDLEKALAQLQVAERALGEAIRLTEICVEPVTTSTGHRGAGNS